MHNLLIAGIVILVIYLMCTKLAENFHGHHGWGRNWGYRYGYGAPETVVVSVPQTQQPEIQPVQQESKSQNMALYFVLAVIVIGMLVLFTRPPVMV